MPRPPSILLFERLHVAALIVSIVAAALSWSGDLAAVMGSPAIARLDGAEHIAPAVYMILRVIIWAAWVLLLYLVARRGSKVAKWLVVIAAALLLVLDGAPTLLAMFGGPLAGWSATATIVETALVVSAAATLFRRDALPWFDRRGVSAEPRSL